MKKVYVASNPLNAHLLKGVLEGENIPSVVQGDFLWTVRGEVPITDETCPSIWVMDDADYDRAMEVIRDFQSGETFGDVEGKEWQCSKCGESNEGQFSECWQCGASRPLMKKDKVE